MPDPRGLQPRFDAWRERANAAIAAALPDPEAEPRRLHAAMRHAALLGGKRVRPLLVYATGTAFGTDLERLDQIATAVEFIHAYSLVHDDLPAMDDDALRRGQPTVHVAFDEAIAILAGDALQALAFEQLTRAPFDGEVRVQLVAELARAAGAHGMCGGQALDIAATGRADALDLPALQRLHAMKTGALLRSAVRMGAIASGADATARVQLDDYAEALGLAFQVRDDLLDVEGDHATLGKTPGKDAAQAKATFPALIGIEASRTRLAQLASDMQAALEPFDDAKTDASALRALARMVVERDR